MSGKYVVGIDQGTTRTKAIVFDHKGEAVATAVRQIQRFFPRPGWVEQDPKEIWEATVAALREAMQKSKGASSDIAALGIADQGETIIMWNRQTGKPVCNAIVWQCRRTAEMCEQLKKKDLEPAIREKTGLVIDAYFSATKVRWILDNVEEARRLAKSGDLLFGTTDTWLIWNLTGGKSHVTDYATASRTMMFNIHTLSWDKDILSWLGIPESILPKTRGNSEVVGEATNSPFEEKSVPIAGVIVDQQAALFGQTCFGEGDVKCTYGTGCFALKNIGMKPLLSRHGLLTTIAWVLDHATYYALDGGVFIAGAAVQWLKENLKAIASEAESESIAESVEDSGGVYFVPAFVGLAAPHWDMYARGTITGITQGTNQSHIVRATLESIAYQVKDVLDCMEADSGRKIMKLKVDGGPTSNRFLMQFQSDILGIPVEVPIIRETTSLGAAFLAGLAVGFWRSIEDLTRMRKVETTYYPKMSQQKRESLLKGWKRAVDRSKAWAANDIRSDSS